MKIPLWLYKILNARSFGIDKPVNIRVEIIGIAVFVYYLIELPIDIISDFWPQLAVLHPESMLPVILGMAFGPAAAIGAAIGYFLVQLSTDISWGTIFGMIGNFLLAYVAFILWRILTKEKHTNFNFKYLTIFWLVCFIASLVSALIIVGGYSWLNLPASFKIVFLNNFVWSAVFGPFILNAVKRGVLNNLFNE